jgi:hypothetical protein
MQSRIALERAGVLACILAVLKKLSAASGVRKGSGLGASAGQTDRHSRGICPRENEVVLPGRLITAPIMLPRGRAAGAGGGGTGTTGRWPLQLDLPGPCLGPAHVFPVFCHGFATLLPAAVPGAARQALARSGLGSAQAAQLAALEAELLRGFQRLAAVKEFGTPAALRAAARCYVAVIVPVFTGAYW